MKYQIKTVHQLLVVPEEGKPTEAGPDILLSEHETLEQAQAELSRMETFDAMRKAVNTEGEME